MLKSLSIFYKKPISDYFFLLISLYPILTIIGEFFENLTIILLGIVSIFYFIGKKQFISFKDLPFVTFFLILLINTLNAENSNDVIKSLKYLFYFFILFFCLKIKFDKNIFNILYNIFLLIFFTLFILFIDTIIQKVFGYNTLGYRSLACYFDSIKIENCRVSSFFGDEYVVGSFISKILVILSTYYLLIQRKFLILFPILILGFVSIYFSGERMALGFFYNSF